MAIPPKETHTGKSPVTQTTENAAKAVTGKSPDAVGGLQNDANPEARNPNPTALPETKEGEGTIPHPGGANARPGSGAFSGGCVPQAPDPPPPEADPSVKK